MGKGSRRRLAQISEEQLQENWDRIFKKEDIEAVREMFEEGGEPSMVSLDGGQTYHKVEKEA